MLIVTPLPAAALPTGLRRRLEHLLDHVAMQSAAPPQVRHLFESESRSAAQTLVEARSKVRGAFGDDVDEVLLLGLGSLGMLIAAHEFARRGARVTFDQCDSALDHVLTDLRDLPRPRRRALLNVVARIALIASLDRKVELTYISAADARRDRVLALGRRRRVIGPSAPRSLATLDAPDLGAIERVVVPADFASSHLRAGLDMLRAAIGSDCPLPIDLYGPARPATAIAGATYRGYAEDLRDVYDGNTVVFVANVDGAGVANKLVEAAAARRPVIAHPSAVERLGAPIQGWLYRDGRELRDVLEQIATGGAPSTI